jgi:enoyl-CoA hydratase
MSYHEIIYEPGKVARLILNRPRYYNAQSYLMREEMDDAFHRAASDDKVGAIVLSGAGSHFSAGHDIGTPEDSEYREAHGLSLKNPDRHHKYRDMRAICLENTMRWRNLPKPTIAMVNGYCIFGGWIFASAMDVVFAAEDALFLPGPVQYFPVPWDLTPRKAREILLEHRYITAWEAYEYGFVNRVFPPEDLEKETLAYAGRVADNYLNNPLWVRLTKFSINHMQDAMGFTTEMEAHYNAYCLMESLQPIDLTRPDKGGYARTHVARENLELTRPWLQAIRRDLADAGTG